MSSLFADSFDHYTTPAEKWDVVAGSATISGTYARNGVGGIYLSGTTASLTKTIAAVPGVVIGQAVQLQGTPTFSTTTPQWTFSDGTVRVSGYITADRRVALYHDTGSSLIGSGTTQLTVGAWHYVEIRVQPGATGTASVWVDAVREVHATPTIAGGNLTSVAVKGTDAGHYADDVYLLSTTGTKNTGALGVVVIDAIYPNDTGTTTQWSVIGAGANWQAVDENPPSTTDYVHSSTEGDIDTYNYGAAPTTIGTLFAVQTVAYAALASSDTATCNFVVRQGATETTQNMITVTGTDYRHFAGMDDQDPTDSADWTAAKVNSAEFGLERVT